MIVLRRDRGALEAGRVRPSRPPARSRLRRFGLGLIALAAAGLIGSGAALWAHGYRIYVVHTGSMEPSLVPGDVVIDAAPTGHYRAGEVLTFRHSDLTTDVVTHRVVDVTPTGLIHTKGDANDTADVWSIRPDQVRGKVVFKAAGLGYLVVFLQQPSGIAALATLLVAIALLWQLFFPTEPDYVALPPLMSDAPSA
jgi:signal peptidase